MMPFWTRINSSDPESGRFASGNCGGCSSAESRESIDSTSCGAMPGFPGIPGSATTRIQTGVFMINAFALLSMIVVSSSMGITYFRLSKEMPQCGHIGHSRVEGLTSAHVPHDGQLTWIGSGGTYFDVSIRIFSPMRRFDLSSANGEPRAIFTPVATSAFMKYSHFTSP